jgi:hypothetical protein
MKTWAGSAILVLLVVPAISYGIAGTSLIAQKGTPVEVREGWPDGTGALVNDPTRGDGHLSWFSNLPNDVCRYEMNVAGKDDVDRLVAALAKVKAPVKRICLDPGDDARTARFPNAVPKGPAVGALFAIGHQPTLNRWFANLPEPVAGARKFGVHELKEAPTALPPTLTLYVRHPAVDLAKLRVPAGIEVVAGFFEADRLAHKDDPVYRAIDAFVAARKAPPEKEPK